MNFENNKGITLMALIVSVIVLLMIAGISIDAVVGDNGIIAQAQDAKIMTQLSEELFDMESDITSIRIENVKKKKNSEKVKMKVLEVINALHANPKYTVYMKKSVLGVRGFDIRKNDSTVDMQVSLNGDVYLDNYKRGKIQIAELTESKEIPAKYGKIAITANDSTYEYDSSKNIVQLKSTDDKINFWLDANSDIFSFSKVLRIYPLKTDYEISVLAAEDVMQPHEFASYYDEKYVLYPIANGEKQGDDYYFEIFVTHFIKDTEIELTEYFYKTVNNRRIRTNILTLGGTLLTRAGVSLSTEPDFSANGKIFSISIREASILQDKNEKLEEYSFLILKEYLNEYKNKRVYYRPYIGFRNWAYTEDDIEYYYNTETKASYGSVKYIDM